MRTLIRDLDTGAFFKTKGDWTTNTLQAFDFQDAERAITAARDLGLKNLELHVTSDDGKSLFGKPLETGLQMPMNFISTNDADWVDACEDWARKQAPFEVRDFRGDAHDIFAEFLCNVYQYRLERKENTAIFTRSISASKVASTRTQ